jgi:gamma-glutamyltranspeptidase
VSAGIAVTPHPAASEAAAEVLREGGGAVDAAVAASAVLCVVHPHQASVGGHLSAMVWPAGEAGPAGIVGVGGSGPGEDVTPPGTPQAWGWLVERFGRWGLAPLVERAVSLAADGWTVTPAVAAALAANTAWLCQEDAAWRLWPPLQAGMTLRNPDLATTLRELGRHGFGSFQYGDVARSIAETVARRGGSVTLDDLRSYRSALFTSLAGGDVLRLAEASDAEAEAATVCVADGEGTVVALVQGFRTAFGSGVVAEGTGILLNNGWAPLGALPAMVARGGRPWAAVAASTGDGQRQVLAALVDGGGVAEAVAAPRLHAPSPGQLWVEADHPQARDILRSTPGASPVPPIDPRVGQVQALRLNPDGEWEGGADPRTAGVVEQAG